MLWTAIRVSLALNLLTGLLLEWSPTTISRNLWCVGVIAWLAAVSGPRKDGWKLLKILRSKERIQTRFFVFIDNQIDFIFAIWNQANKYQNRTDQGCPIFEEGGICPPYQGLLPSYPLPTYLRILGTSWCVIESQFTNDCQTHKIFGAMIKFCKRKLGKG